MNAVPEHRSCLAIVPAFNEVASVGAVVEELLALGDVDVLVVDDGSGDGTAAAAVRAGARVISLPFNLGIGRAVQAGYMVARASGYTTAVQVDGDGQHPTPAVRAVLERLAAGESDIVIGSRFIQRGGFASTRARRAGIRVLARLVSTLARVRVSDPTSGLRATNARGIRLFSDVYPQDYPEVEAVIVAARAGLLIEETSVEMRERQGGRSSIGPLGSIYYMIKVSLAVLMEALRRPYDVKAGEP